MTMDNTVKENSKRKRSNEADKSLLKSSSKLQKNGGGAYSTSNGNNCAEKENIFKNEQFDCTEESITCGLGPCSPNWLQSFASKQAFLVTFCLTWVLQGMFATYFVSVITTVEKVYQFQSKMTGIILMATEIGQIGCTLLFTYYGGHGHRPRWIASGTLLFAICSLCSSLPYFIFPSTTYDVVEQGLNASLNSSSHALCHSLDPFSNGQSDCGEATSLLSEQQLSARNVVIIIFVLTSLGIGMGQTPVYTLGISYIDDNVAGRESPLYFTITIGVRILGPALGFLMGSLCTRLYINLSLDTKMTPSDPRWQGAWWLGLVLDSALLMMISIAMFSFPKKLSSYRATPVIRSKQDVGRKKPTLKDFPKTIKRLLKNDILMLRTASSVLHIFPIAGLYTFLPKFLESQFRFPAHSANMAAGVGGILVMGLGIIMSGVFILRVKPNAKFVAGWVACAAGLYSLGMATLMFIGCPMSDLAGIRHDSNGKMSFYSECSTTCHCDEKFSPVCGPDNLTYYSACYAGCQNVTSVDGVLKFTNCSCLKGSANTSVDHSWHESDLMAGIGYCDSECNNFIWYIMVFSFFVFIHSTSEVGSMLLTLRCVDPRDKAMALGVIQFAIGLFGNVPCSFLYGVVVDAACLVWDMVCGSKGACSLYDRTVFRHYFHGMTSFIMFCAFVVDLVVWYRADKINFGTEEPLPPAHEEELTPITEKSCFESKN